jgi:hypothetical protein
VSQQLVPTPQYHAQLPAFLRDPALFSASDAAIAGIGGGAPPMISIRASKFRLATSGGEEQMVNQLHLDVVVLAGNANVSKLYYAEAYNPADGDAKPPTCFSDNGIAPSTEAGSPQSATCAQCPHAAWGSKVTPAGSKIKACSDSKKLAVVLAADTPVVVNGAAGIAKAYEQVFLLRVPAASMLSWKTYGKSVIDRGIPLQGVLTRVTFDPQADYPALLFQPTGFVADEPTFKHLMSKKESSEVKTAIGANDQPRQAAPALAAPPSFMAAEPAPVAPPPPPAPVAVAPAPVAPAPEAPRRPRGRPAQQDPVAAAAAPVAPVAAAPAPGVIVAPTPASNDLDALLAKALA